MNHIFQTSVLIMECTEFNCLCKHIKKIRSSQPAISVLNWVKHQSFPVSIVNTGLGKVFCNFRNSPIVLFTLVVITFKCSWKVNRLSRNIPRCFWHRDCETMLLLKRYGDCETMLLLKRNEGWQIFLVFLLRTISWACLLGSGLKFIFHWKAHLLIWYKSLFNSFAEVSTSCTTENKDVSSGNNLHLMISHQQDH